MTEEQLIQEYSDAVYPKIAKALISETKKMLIEKACLLCEKQLKGILGNTKEAHRLAYEDFKQAMEE